MQTSSRCVTGAGSILFSLVFKVQVKNLKQGEVFLKFSDFRKTFYARFLHCLNVLYIKTSPSAENRKTFESEGRLPY